jgi:NAD(P)-dependent dehydrogenase (short-subunit alcohol dehydrogenase family)
VLSRLCSWHGASLIENVGTDPKVFCAISSSSADKPRATEELYAACKAAQAHLTRSLAAQGHAHVMPSLFKPGGMQTPFWDDHRPAGYDEFLDPAKVADKIPFEIQAQLDSGNSFIEIEIPRGSL